eukprot:8423827-Lingulodinium_polyedra.AAC.1
MTQLQLHTLVSLTSRPVLGQSAPGLYNGGTGFAAAHSAWAEKHACVREHLHWKREDTVVITAVL